MRQTIIAQKDGNLTFNDNNFTQNIEEEDFFPKKVPFNLIQLARRYRSAAVESNQPVKAILHNPWSSRNLQRFFNMATQQSLR